MMVIASNIKVCPISVTQWYDHGVNPCMYELLCSTLLFTLVSIAILISLVGPASPCRRPTTFGGICKLVCHFVVILVLIARLVVSVVLNGSVYAYFAIQISIDTLAWIMAISMLLSSSRHKSPLALICYWFGSLFRYCGSISAWDSPYWFWQRTTVEQEVQFTLFFVQLGCVLYICIHDIVRCCVQPSHTQADRQLLINAEPAPLPETTTRNPRLPGGPSLTSSAWSDVASKVIKLLPFVWPTGNLMLQLFVFICIVLLIAARVVNVMMPLLYRDAVNELTAGSLALETICLYCLVAFCQGTGVGAGGMLGIIRSQLWLSVSQYTNKRVNCDLFRHIQELSIGWHMSRKTGEVIRIVDRSSSAITNLLNYILFSIGPCIVDLVIAIVYFVVAFNMWYGLIIFVTMAFYMVATIVLTEWRTKFRREMNQHDNEVKAKAVDTLLNFETVKYYGAEDFESQRYAESLDKYLHSQYITFSTLNLVNLVQNLIISAGTLGGSLLVVYDVHAGRLTVGDFVLFVSYIRQLYMPLNYFGTYYRMIQTNFIDLENMFELLQQPKDVKDVDNAPLINVTTGRICFENVSFRYREEREIIKNVSFKVDSGQSVALVGPSGSGKSTIMKLLFRFYDIDKGLITVDNQDICEVTQKSLRQAIGVVPQDTVLFNETIRYNIRYGKINSTDTEVDDASKAADIHQAIQTFPDGYDTIVGERGLKLSGGEKQRVAIARTLLKSPQIVLLDEATSALDTKTERNIQSSLNQVCEGKTSLIIAHRLSTIVHCDKILVLKDGEIVETGTHDELLQQHTVYADMWHQQITGKGDFEVQKL